MYSPPTPIATVKVAAELRTVHGDTLVGDVFVSGDRRMKDMLNSTDLFIAFQRGDGEIEMINKHCIARVRPIRSASEAEAA
jgi:hypothetical protein